MQRRLAASLLVIVAALSCERGEAPTTALDAGVVASPEAHAADVGAEVLRRGGNAVDAAVAVQFALAVTNPYGGNIGGGGFVLIHDSASGEGTVYALDFRETAPAAAHRDMFLGEDGEVVPGESLYTHRASGVPGTVAGMWEMHRRFGRLDWAALVEPAAKLAADGFALDAWTAESIAEARKRLENLDEERRRHIDFSRYFRGGEGDRLVQAELAATLERIAERGPDDFYRGETARLIDEEMRRGGGLVTLSDLDGYRAVWRTPVEGDYRGHRIVSMPPPSSGGIALVQMLNMLEQFKRQPARSTRRVHVLAEIEKRAFADRSVFLGDPDMADVPAEELTSDEYARRRAAGISFDRKTDPATIRAGEVPVLARESAATTHFSVVDRRGMAVSCTTTLNAGYGSGIVVDGAGFLLNNEMDDFSSKPGVPNLYGVTGDEANAIAPGKRMLSSMSPTLVFHPDGSFWMALGSPGGPTIFTTVMQVIVAKIDDGATLQEAIDAPRAHHQWPPRSNESDPVFVESREPYRQPDHVLGGLRALGYDVVERKSIGDVQAVEVDGRHAIGVADERRAGGVARE
ncbi:MAG: gamma-glutamyltransferase [Acidobacteriota bacterium]|nr:gamma-glutamyltransferase [Acidobacteriota bacterium]